MSHWPKAEIFQYALRGIREVFQVNGHNAAGVRSSLQHLIFLPDTGVVCTTCSVSAPLPDPPCGQGDPYGPRNPLFTKDTKAYAMYLLTNTIHPFTKEHLHEDPVAA